MIMRKQQQGMVVLTVSLIMLAVLSGIIIPMSQMMITNERLYYNTLQNKTAEITATNALTYATVNSRKSNIMNPTTPLQSPDITNSHTIEFGELIDNTASVIVTGYGNDNTSVYKLSQTLSFIPYLAYTPAVTLIARDNIQVKFGTLANSTMETYTGKWWDAIAWSGGTIDTNASTIVDTDGNMHRTYENASDLNELSNATFFRNFFSGSATSIRELSTIVDCSLGCDSSSMPSDTESLIWVDGDLTVDTDLGTPTNPVIIVVTGKFKIQSYATFNGVIYIDTNWDNDDGAGYINGSVMVNGSINVTGDLTIAYDLGIIDVIQQTINYGKVISGSVSEL